MEITKSTVIPCPTLGFKKIGTKSIHFVSATRHDKIHLNFLGHLKVRHFCRLSEICTWTLDAKQFHAIGNLQEAFLPVFFSGRCPVHMHLHGFLSAAFSSTGENNRGTYL